MPLAYRVMRRDADGFPSLGPTSLGVRPGDVDVDGQGQVLVNGKGMSVNPRLENININRVPKRLRPRLPGASGSNNSACFRFGEGMFQHGPFAKGLDLVPDSATHGNVTPSTIVLLATYESDLASTREAWTDGEGQP